MRPESVITPGEPTEEERAEALRQLEEAQRELLDAPTEDIIANHCYGLFELAAVYLSARPPAVDKARVAIDALGALVEGLSGRLGAHEADMAQALAQIRLAFVQISNSQTTTNGESASSNAQEE